MNQTWHSLYLPLSESEKVADALRALLAAQGYQPYDPFPGGTGTPPGLRAMVRQLVAPAQEGWVRVLGQPQEAVLPDLSATLGTPALYGWLTGEEGGFTLFKDGLRHDGPAAFESYLRPEKSADLLRQAFAGTLPVPVVESGGPPLAVLGADALPPELQQLAQDRGIDPKKADRLAKSLTEGLFGKLGKQFGGEARGRAGSGARAGDGHGPRSVEQSARPACAGDCQRAEPACQLASAHLGSRARRLPDPPPAPAQPAHGIDARRQRDDERRAGRAGLPAGLHGSQVGAAQRIH